MLKNELYGTELFMREMKDWMINTENPMIDRVHRPTILTCARTHTHKLYEGMRVDGTRRGWIRILHC